MLSRIVHDDNVGLQPYVIQNCIMQPGIIQELAFCHIFRDGTFVIGKYVHHTGWSAQITVRKSKISLMFVNDVSRDDMKLDNALL